MSLTLVSATCYFGNIVPENQIPHVYCRLVNCFRIFGKLQIESKLALVLIMGRMVMLKFVVVSGASFAMLTAAAAADLPRAQPVYQQAQVGKAPIGKAPIGKAPIGKSPIGKTPVGKAPVGKAPLVTKG